MSILTEILYNTPGSFTFDADDVEFVGGEAPLKMQRTTEHLTEDFADDTGFTYDPLKAEFVGGVCRQKSQRPANAVFGATYTSSVNGSWGSGSLTGTAVNGAAVSGAQLDLTGYAQKYVDYNGLTGLGIQTGAIRFKYTPPYSGSPSSAIGIITNGKGAGLNGSVITLLHQTNGTIRIIAYDSSNVLKIDSTFSAAAWSPVAGTPYEMELNYDFNTGATRFFINGVQRGSTIATTMTRGTDAQWLRVGGYFLLTYQSNFYIEDLELFNTPQHTADYTPGYTLPETDYLGSTVNCPPFTHPFPGSSHVFKFTNAAAVITGAARFIFLYEGVQYWWDGIGLAVSNGSYSQANTIAEIAAAHPQFTIEGGAQFTIQVIFQDGNTQNAIDSFDFTYVGDTGYTTGGVPVTVNSAISADEILSIAESATKPTNTGVKYTFLVGGVEKWYTGGAWVPANGTYGEANAASELTADVLALLLDDAYNVKLRAYLYTSDGLVRPSLEVVEIGYDYGSADIPAINMVTVYGFVAPATDGIVQKVIAKLKVAYRYNNAVIILPREVSAAVDAEGRWDMELPDTASMEAGAKYEFKFLVNSLLQKVEDKAVPNVAIVDYVDLL